MNNLVALLLFAISYQPPAVIREGVDIVELNHFYDEHGRLVFDQVIFYDWDAERPQIREWRLAKDHGSMPARDWFRKFESQSSILLSGEPAAGEGSWVCRWQDGGALRAVYATSYKETWTQYDPELVEREILPKEKRRALKSLPSPKKRSSENGHR